ncbi:T6SS immunity protein Tli4 family protein [Pseudomonas citronellolis]|uniref:T6SS immunity protein Tli4 family protein n=1 Tax=Pseudomonas citronellolis TaxID=53408 RepID=UPI0022BA2942|nr:T6SS immunity protein Tli4 family protein [Pseudomonas citronellolis]
MTRKHILLSLIATAMLLGACAYGWRQWRLAHPDRSHEMTALTQNMRTHCVGRLLIDLPEGSTWKPDASGATIGGIKLAVETDIRQERFKERVEKRWREVEAIKLDNYRKRYVRPSERHDPTANAAVFLYEFEYIDGPNLQGVWSKDLFYQVEGYYWADGTLFKLGPALNGQEKIAALLPRLYARKADEIPFSPGLCLNGGFVRGYYDLGESEEVSWGFSLPRMLGLVIRHTAVRSPMQPLLERNREAEREMAAFVARILAQSNVVAGNTVYRQAARSEGAMDGQEYAMGGTQEENPASFKTNVAAEWAFPGAGLPSPQPSVAVSMGSTFRTSSKPLSLGAFPEAQDTPDGPTEAEFFEVWDAVVASVRFRPGALTPPPLKPAPAPPTSREQAEADQRFLDDFIASRPGGAGKPPE